MSATYIASEVRSGSSRVMPLRAVKQPSHRFGTIWKTPPTTPSKRGSR
jgi:hypothetical protein